MAPTEQQRERENSSSTHAACPSYTVGYAMLPGKSGSVVQPSLVALAAERGIRLVAVDAALPLADQGPFHLIVHKLYGKKWCAQLEAYSALHPSVPIVDAPAAIERLLDRASMLAVVSGLRIAAAATSGGAGESTTTAICVPSQVAVHDASVLADPDNKLLGALHFPLIAKPLAVDGSAESHQLRLVYRRDGLRDLRPPLVLQEFVNHGGVLFKVYVVGDRATCVRRSSLPDVPKERLLDLDADPSVPFANISGKPPVHAGSATADAADDDADNADMPAAGFVDEVARELRRALDLNLINFDMFRGSDGQYFIIDINYFPGFAKMPGYETALTDFFLKMILHGTRPGHGQPPGLEARDAEPGPTNVEPGQAEA